jgi:tetratricopeptide (TPR) repeat protein
MTERLLTQPRVLVFYLSLLFYPLTSRSTLIHDIEISRSLFDPVSTILSLLTVFFIVAAAVFLARKKPLLSYGILFFFLNHLIEGSFIALELIYEHRNYVPSMLLFVPLSLLLVEGLEHYAERKSIVSLLAGAVAFVIVLLGVSVFLQNNIYKTEISLWTDNAEKSPRLHYVRQNLATSYFVAGRLEEAVREANLALSSPLSAGAAAKSRTYGLLGEYYYLKGALDQALLYYLASVKDNPSFHTSYRRISEIMTAKNRLPEAEEMILKALAQNPGSYAYHTILARILLRRGSPDDAIREARISLKLNGDQADPYVILSESFRAKKDNRAALHFRKVADAFQLRGRQQQAAAFAHQVAP